MTRQISNRFLALTFALGLAACSAQSPGEQDLQSLSYAEELPASIPNSRSDPGYLVLHLRSDTDFSADDFNAVYADASVCPFDERLQVVALGPVTEAPEPGEIPAERLPKDKGGKGFAYRVYVPSVTEMYDNTQGNSAPVKTIDLREATDDICVRLIHTDMPRASYSNIVRIPAAYVKMALSEAP